MRNPTVISVCRYLLLGTLQIGVALSLGCQGDISGLGGEPPPSGNGGTGGMNESPLCSGASDPRLVVAPQRILRLTMNETLNTVRYLIDDTEAQALVDQQFIAQDAVDSQRQFPPLQESNIIGTSYQTLDNIAQHVANYVTTNFTTLARTLAGCSDASDACATMYINKLAGRAYRRQLTSAEQTRFTALYTKLKSQTVNGLQVTSTVPQAVGYAVYGLLSSPQLLWRWELGQPGMTSKSPAGIPLTDAELATHLSFFLTDQPPDDQLLAAANAGTLKQNLGTHVDRLLQTSQTKDWLRKIIETVYLINQLPKINIDPMAVPIFNSQLVADMQQESQRFLDNVMWGDGSKLTDMLLSRTAFPNKNLADNIYMVDAPGASMTSFVKATLPSDKRSGILTNAAFITSRARVDGKFMVVPRGRVIASVVLCMPPSPPPDSVLSAVSAAKANFETQTAKEQIAVRASTQPCQGCHAQFDAYGLLLENYDAVARYRTTDDIGKPVDSSTTLPDALGGVTARDAVDLARILAGSPAFANCMAQTMLQYSLVEYNQATVELPIQGRQAGCAAADVVTRFKQSGGTFADLVKATTKTPAFILRNAAQ